MDWPVFGLLSANSSITSIVGLTPPRIFEDTVPQEHAMNRPYIVWNTVGGTPLNYLDQVPAMDSGRVQIDVYASGKLACKTLAKLVRDTLEPHAHMIGTPVSMFEVDTKLFRYLLEFQFFTARS